MESRRERHVQVLHDMATTRSRCEHVDAYAEMCIDMWKGIWRNACQGARRMPAWDTYAGMCIDTREGMWRNACTGARRMPAQAEEHHPTLE